MVAKAVACNPDTDRQSARGPDTTSEPGFGKRHSSAQTCGDALCLKQRARNNDCELISSIPACNCAGRQICRNDVADRANGLCTSKMTVHIIDAFQAIHIQRKKRKRCPCLTGSLHEVEQARFERTK